VTVAAHSHESCRWLSNGHGIARHTDQTAANSCVKNRMSTARMAQTCRTPCPRDDGEQFWHTQSAPIARMIAGLRATANCHAGQNDGHSRSRRTASPIDTATAAMGATDTGQAHRIPSTVCRREPQKIAPFLHQRNLGHERALRPTQVHLPRSSLPLRIGAPPSALASRGADDAIQTRTRELIETIIQIWRVPPGHKSGFSPDRKPRLRKKVHLSDLINAGALTPGMMLFSARKKYSDKIATLLPDARFVCEAHPWRAFRHDACAGPGKPCAECQPENGPPPPPDDWQSVSSTAHALVWTVRKGERTLMCRIRDDSRVGAGFRRSDL
jgi:hypothetical protein